MKSQTRRMLLQLLGFAVLSPVTSGAHARRQRNRTETTSMTTNDDAQQLAANLAVVTRYARAWQAGDFAAVRDCYHDELTLHYFGSHSLAGDHVGKAAALGALAEISRRARRKLVEVVDIMAGPQRAALVVREHFERDDEQATLLRVLVYSIKESRLHECWVLDAEQERVDRFLR